MNRTNAKSTHILSFVNKKHDCCTLWGVLPRKPHWELLFMRPPRSHHFDQNMNNNTHEEYCVCIRSYIWYNWQDKTRHKHFWVPILVFDDLKRNVRYHFHCMMFEMTHKRHTRSATWVSRTKFPDGFKPRFRFFSRTDCESAQIRTTISSRLRAEGARDTTLPPTRGE